MQHVLITLSITLLVGGCAVLDMPADDAGSPDWVEERLQSAGDGRQAPSAVPVTSLSAGEARAMDEAALILLAEKDAMEAEARRRDEESRRGSATEFLTDGQARTQPPQQ